LPKKALRRPRVANLMKALEASSRMAGTNPPRR
jgi:hypothetical protein